MQQFYWSGHQDIYTAIFVELRRKQIYGNQDSILKRSQAFDYKQ